MKIVYRTAAFLCIVFFLQSGSFPQKIDKDWESVPSATKKIWYYAPSIDKAKSKVFKIRVIQQFAPPLSVAYVSEPVFKSQTEYRINLNIARYGIVKIDYFNSRDKLIAHYNYDDVDKSDDYQYSYPITDDKTVVSIIKKYIINKELNDN